MSRLFTLQHMVQNQLNPALYQSQLQYHHPTIDELAVAQHTMQLQAAAAAAQQQHTQQSSALVVTPISHINSAQAPLPSISTTADLTLATSTCGKDSQPLSLLPADPKTATTSAAVSLVVSLKSLPLTAMYWDPTLCLGRDVCEQ